ncbi:hypothetical protein A2U01_0027364, partial [Trifolium medium]|nr:hypothetical protein [Trifolium medium]
MEIEKFNLFSYVNGVHNGDDYIQQCGEITRALQEHGVILVEDPRFHENLNREVVSTMQTFFSNIGGVQHGLVEQGKSAFHVDKRLTEEELEMMPVEYHPSPVAIDDEEVAMNFHYSWEMGKEIKEKEPDHFSKTVVSEMVGLGLGLPKHTFTS